MTGTRVDALHRFPPSQRFFLLPGQYFVTERPMVISTVLGSCVAVCLFDPVARVAGMNHFMLAGESPPDQVPLGVTEVGRYGIEAMELLINAMMRRGGQKGRFQAKAFGGGCVLPPLPRRKLVSVGEANCSFVRRFLEGERIPLVSQSLGGELGRVIHFHTDTQYVWSRFIRNASLAAKVAKEELAVWDSLNKKPRPSKPILF